MRDKVPKWRKMRSVSLSLLLYSVVRGRQQENSHRQVVSALACPLAFSLVAGQPRRCSDFPKNGKKCEMRVVRCYGTRSRAASSMRNTHQQVGSARARPLAFSLIVSQPRRFSPRLHCGSESIVTFVLLRLLNRYWGINVLLI